MLTTSRRAIQYPNPNRSDVADVPLHMGYLAAALDVDVVFNQGTDAARVASAHQSGGGRFWWTTDTFLLWYDDGTIWRSVAPTANLIGPLANRPAATTLGSGSTWFATDQVADYVTDGTQWIRKGVPAGTTVDWFKSDAAVPTGWVLYDGGSLPAATGIYADLYAHLGNTLVKPDTRGRFTVAQGTNSDVSAMGANDGLAIASRSPKHNMTNGLTLPDHTHANSFTLPAHSHASNFTLPDHAHANSFTLPGHSHSHGLTLPSHSHQVNGHSHGGGSHGHGITDNGHNHTLRGGDRASGAYAQVGIGLDYNYMEQTADGGTIVSAYTGISVNASGGIISAEAPNTGYPLEGGVGIGGAVGAVTSNPAITGAVGSVTSNPAIAGSVGAVTSNPAISGGVGSASSFPAIPGAIGPGGSRPTDGGAYIVCAKIAKL